MNSLGLELTCLQELQDRISAYLGFNMLVTDVSLNPITTISYLHPFCEIINSTEPGKQACVAARQASLQSVSRSGQPEIHHCHAGLAHIAMPVRVRGQAAVMVFGGGVALEPLEDSEIVRLAAHLGLSFSDLLGASRLVPLWTKERMYQAMDLYSSITGVISELIRRAQDLKQLMEVGQEISSSLDLDRVLRSAVESVSRVLDIDGCFLRLLEGDLGLLQLKASWSTKDHPLANLKVISLEQNLVPPEVMEPGKPVATSEVSSDARFAHIRPCYPGETRAAAVAPVSTGGKVLGTLEVFSGRSRVWTEEEVGYLIAIGAQTGLAIAKAQLYKSMKTSYLSTTQALAAALEAKDSYTQGHSHRVAECARSIAEKLGHPPENLEEVYLAGLLHDIGKIGVNEQILTKPANLSPAEKADIQNHSLIGARILEQTKLPASLVETVRYHHEDYNGDGYPDGIAGEQIPPFARIIRVADTYDALTSDRPYRKGHSNSSAIEEIRRNARVQFDPKVVEAFEEVMEGYGPLDKAALS